MANTPSTTRPPVADIRAETINLLQQGESNVALTSFARVYLQEMSAPDMAQFTPTQLAATIRSLVSNAAIRTKGKPTIRCYSTASAPSAWEGKYCILDVIQDDMPFLVDSITTILNGMNLTVHLAMNPELAVVRDGGGALQTVQEANGTPSTEAWMQFFFDNITADQQKQLITTVASVLEDVRRAVEDWPAMRQRAYDVRDQLVRTNIVSAAELQETQTFVTWMDNEHFTFLGSRDYKVTGEGESAELTLVNGSGLGILRADNIVVFDGLRDGHHQPPEVRNFLNEKRLLLVTKSSKRATVHRGVPMDAVFIKLFDSGGRLIGKRLLLGLFTSLAYSRNARDIPVIREKVARIMARAGINPKGHDGKALTHILDTYPRDEMFQIDDDTLFAIAMGIMQLQERKRVALFVRHDPFARFVSCLVYVPREAFSTATRLKITSVLEASFNGTQKEFALLLDQNPLARLHVIISTSPLNTETPDLVAVEQTIAALCRSWQDRVRDVLVNACGSATGLELLRIYADSFSTTYRDTISPDDVYDDIAMLETVRTSHRLGVKLIQGTEENHYRLKLYHPDSAVMLSATLPMIEHLGFKVETEYGPYEVRLPDERTIWLHDYHVRATHPLVRDFAATSLIIEEALGRIWYGHVENDSFNTLLLTAGLDWQQANIMRILAKYMRQIRIPYAPDTIARSFIAHPTAVAALANIFTTKFNPVCDDRTNKLAVLNEALTAYIRDVPNIDDDRILRCAHNLLQAALRTNFYQTNADGKPKSYVSIKFASQQIEELPLPKPFAEIFVYSPRVKGVHLRGGRIARGGIRWSDRREDFRTEVLGLMKAQQVKNTVIVPVGSKGGFIVKQPPANAADMPAEGVACYQIFMRGLLDITDNIVNGDIVPPANTIRYDNDDPYLVVAADKGTAKFSDIANGISADYNFWLGDAFASGGSAGYDHKHMGITARGAWEAVKRHFRELGIDTQAQSHTCIGVGDMAGDVFGNGMIQSPHTQLLAAFNYAHIFVDPNPDAAAAYRERQHLFTIGKGSWDSYNTSLISTGGGVWPRSQKSIPISDEMKQRFGITADALSGADLCKALLRAPADLLYFGGIGTFIKSPAESDADVGDKANDALRINANELNCRVIGEGANLGMTQLGRITAAQRSIKLNTDAIDNSAGVDTSDHEVNIKILLADIMHNGSMTLETRNELLKGMTEEVAALVLRDNYLQTQALSLTEARANELLGAHKALLTKLESEANLNRVVEFLPDDEELASRSAKKLGLTRPELAIVLAYSKLWFYEKLLNTPTFKTLAADENVARDVRHYFPEPIRHLYGDAIPRHRLASEIAATVLTNEIINRLGSAAVSTLMEKTDAATLAKAYIILRDSFGLTSLWQSIEALDNTISAKAQTVMLLAVNRALDQGLQALVTMSDTLANASASITQFKAALGDIANWLRSHPDAQTETDTMLTADTRVPNDIRTQLQVVTWLPLLPRLCHVMQQSGKPLAQVIPVFMAVDDRLQLRRLHRHLSAQSATDAWQAQALSLLADDMLLVEERLTTNLIIANGDELEKWLATRRMSLARYDELTRAVRATTAPDMALWTLVVRELVWLAGM